MKKYQWLAVFFVMAGSIVIGPIWAQEEERPVLTVVGGKCVEGVFHKYDESAVATSRNETNLEPAIPPFNADDYTIIDPGMLAMVPVDAFGYPMACNTYHDMELEEDQPKADVAVQSDTDSVESKSEGKKK